MERNFSSPIRFKQPRPREEVTWNNFKQVANRPLKRMSSTVAKSFSGNRRFNARMSRYG